MFPRAFSRFSAINRPSLLHTNLLIFYHALERLKVPESGSFYPITKEDHMSRVWQLLEKFGHDEEGAALVEYTVLLGIMLVAVITTIGLVGGWMTTKWASLWSALSTN
jgi:pilus assembly protein Flp/PilA